MNKIVGHDKMDVVFATSIYHVNFSQAPLFLKILTITKNASR